MFELTKKDALVLIKLITLTDNQSLDDVDLRVDCRDIMSRAEDFLLNRDVVSVEDVTDDDECADKIKSTTLCNLPPVRLSGGASMKFELGGGVCKLIVDGYDVIDVCGIIREGKLIKVHHAYTFVWSIFNVSKYSKEWIRELPLNVYLEVNREI